MILNYFCINSYYQPVNATIHFITFSEQQNDAHNYNTASAMGCNYQYYRQVAMNVACHFNILTGCQR